MLRRRFGCSERGSVAIAISVMTLLFSLSLAGLARTVAVLQASRNTQDYATNLSWAEAAVSDVLWRLDQNDPGATTTHVLSRTTSKYSYTATPVESFYPPNNYTILAKGTAVTSRPHGVRVNLARRAQYTYGLYSVSDINLAGGAPATIRGTTAADGTYTPAIIGSSGIITLPSSRTSVGGGDGQDYMFPNGQCVNCYTTSRYRSPDAQHLTADQAPQINPVTLPSGATTACNFTGSLADGTYLCNGDVSFTGNTTINQSGTGVKIYIPAGKSLKLNDKAINYNPACNSAGNASLLQIFMVGGSGSTIGIGSGGTACLSAIVYAPSTAFTPDGQGFTFTGSLMVYSITGNGNPGGFNFYYDRNTSSVTRDWNLSDFREVPAAQVP
jgi:hypothetical protein